MEQNQADDKVNESEVVEDMDLIEKDRDSVEDTDIADEPETEGSESDVEESDKK